jgi:hypothetical protein
MYIKFKYIWFYVYVFCNSVCLSIVLLGSLFSCEFSHDFADILGGVDFITRIFWIFVSRDFLKSIERFSSYVLLGSNILNKGFLMSIDMQLFGRNNRRLNINQCYSYRILFTWRLKMRRSHFTGLVLFLPLVLFACFIRLHFKK